MFQSWNILNECSGYRSCFILKWKVPIMQVLRRIRQNQTERFREWQRTPGKTWTQVVRSSKDLSLIPWHVMASVFGSGRRQCEAGSRISQWRIMYFQKKKNSNPLESAPNSRFFAQWTWRNYLGLEELQSCRSENGCSRVVRATFRETCNGWWASFASNGIASTLGVEWRQPYCLCTAAKDNCRICVCFVVSRKWQSCHMRQSRPWWWQLCGVLEEIDLWHGVIQNTVVTAPESKISWRMSSRSVAHKVLLLPSWQTEEWWPGDILNLVATALESKISYGMFSRFVVYLVLLLQFWRTEPSWHGALDTVVVIVPVSKITWRMFSIFLAQPELLLHFWQMEACWPGAIHTMVATAPEAKISWRMSSRSVAQSVLSKFAYFVRAGERRGCEEVGPSDHWRRKMPNMFDSLVVQLSKNQPETLLPFNLLQALPQLPFWQTEPSWHGALDTVVVTAPESKTSSEMFSIFLAQPELLLQFWQMEACCPGAIHTMVATAPEAKISSRMSSRSVAQSLLSKFAYFVRAGETRGCEEVGPSDHWRRKMPNMFDSLVVQLSKNQPEALLPFDLLQAVPQLPFWQMEAWWHGAMDVMVVTAPESKISWKMLCRSVAQMTGQMNVIVLSLPFWQMDKSWAGAREKTAIDALVTTRTASNGSSTTFRCLWENPGDASSGLTPLKSIEYWPILVDVHFSSIGSTWLNLIYPIPHVYPCICHLTSLLLLFECRYVLLTCSKWLMNHV